MMITDRDQKAIRSLVAYSMPLKITLLDEQLKSFKQFLDGHAGGDVSPLAGSLSNVSA